MDFKALREKTIPQLEQLLRDLFPAGRAVGREFKIGNLRGEAGYSLSINLDTGQWADFATGDKGGDFISLLAARLGYRQSDAAAVVSVMLDDPAAGRKELRFILSGGGKRGDDPSLRGPEPAWTNDQLIIGEWGQPSAVWEYHNSDRRLIFVVARYGEGSEKTYRPWTWTGRKWEARAYDEGRPLYNLAELLDKPNARVLVVEGEKCVDVAKLLLGEWFVPVTWAGGAKAPQHTIWAPLRGRHVVIWPDADPPGHQAMVSIIKRIEGIAASVHVVQVHDLPPATDIADMEELSGEVLAAWIESRLLEHTPPAVGEKLPAGEEWRKGLQLSEKGGVRMTNHNVSLIVEYDPYFTDAWWFEEWDGRFYIGDHPTDDADVFEARVHLSKAWNIEVGADTMYQALEAVLPRRNAVQDWIKGLTWDQQPRFAKLAGEVFHSPAESVPYVAEIMQLLFCGMVARAMEPGCKFDYCVILRGPQGIGKTLFFEKLGGGRYVMLYTHTSQDKDVLGAVAMGWVVSIEELFDTRASLRELKSMISSTVDTWRRPYHRDLTTQPKRCVLVGTTDAEADFLDDMAGYRRFLIVECGQAKFDLALFDQMRDQLFAEACVRWRSVPEWHQLGAASLEQSREVSANWEVEDAWLEPILAYLEGKDVVTMLDVLSNCLFIPANIHDSRVTRRVHRILTALRFQRARLRVKSTGRGGRLRAYQRLGKDDQ